MTRGNLVGALAVLSLGVIPALAASSAGLTGIWMRGDGNARVRIAPCGTKICLTNVWVKDPSSGEAVGDKIVVTVKSQSNSTLVGEAFDPKRNLTFSMQMSAQKSSLTMHGCMVGGLICKNDTWSRIQ